MAARQANWPGVKPNHSRGEPDREQRIYNEIVVDAHDGDEQSMAWFNYLEEALAFPFLATCIAARAISPLRDPLYYRRGVADAGRQKPDGKNGVVR